MEVFKVCRRYPTEAEAERVGQAWVRAGAENWGVVADGDEWILSVTYQDPWRWAGQIANDGFRPCS